MRENRKVSWVHKLENWFEKSARALPWRLSRDPYRIWLSEVMLQQTQVAAVIPYYERFLGRFPNLRTLAEAPEQDVLAVWSGLGYYSRARNLQRGARTLLEHFDGKFPKTREEILSIPGIGPYTAGAVLSIAFDLPEPIVDGNVQRVFSRFFLFKNEIESTRAKVFFWKKAKSAVEASKHPRFFNQALMELGALICAKGSPRCVSCPISEDCLAFKKGVQATLPKRKPKREKIDLLWSGFILESDGKLFVSKNPKGSWWEDLWDFPRITDGNVAQFREKLSGVSEWTNIGTQRHTVTHHRIQFTTYFVRLKKPKAPRFLEGKWLSPDELRKSPTSSLVRKILANTSDY